MDYLFMGITGLEKKNILYQESSLCYQCAKCSSGCPVVEEMDMFPHIAIHLASLGLEENALDKETIWICASCYACAVKCPNEIEIPHIMNQLKQLAIEKGIEP
ncbi:MAG: 4Fe-4S dicluster domain-containing protein, partial [Bacteroidales bacterium]